MIVTSLVNLVLMILVVGLVIALLWWLADYIPLPPPFNRAAKAVIAVIGVLIIIAWILPLAGVPVLVR